MGNGFVTDGCLRFVALKLLVKAGELRTQCCLEKGNVRNGELILVCVWKYMELDDFCTTEGPHQLHEQR